MIAIAVFVYAEKSYSQCPTIAMVEEIEGEKENNKISTYTALQKLTALKTQCKKCSSAADSVHARILHRMGTCEYELAGFPNQKSIDYTLLAIKINTSKSRSASGSFAVRSYFNMVLNYQELGMYDEALAYCDSAIGQAKKYPSVSIYKIRSRIEKILILKDKGDYQKCIEDCTIGIAEANKIIDLKSVLEFFNQRAEVYFYQTQIANSLKDIDSALYYSNILNDNFNYATALKTKAQVYESLKDYSNASLLYSEAIKTRIKTGEANQIADDYVDFGNFYIGKRDYLKAKQCYFKTIEYAQKGNHKEKIAKAHLNLGVIYYFQNNFSKSGEYYTQAIQDLKISIGKNILYNPSLTQFNINANNDLVLDILNNKTHLLLCLFNKTHDQNYLNASLQTARLTDSFITKMRHEQISERSKLYWRNRTREFYTNAIEACYLSKDATLAFFFMEKSRAVLLNDKLNEFGASAALPSPEKERKQMLQINIIEEHQKLLELDISTKEYGVQEQKLLEAQENFDHYIKSLEHNFKTYYQYKYEDYTPSLNQLQNYLLLNRQGFIHYFFNDTVCYALGLTANTTKFEKLSAKDIASNDISTFLQLCADNEKMYNEYSLFKNLSNKLYKVLFQPLNIPKGRVIICPDNLFIPFEIFCSNSAENNFLVNDYAFSYVYSARYLMRDYNQGKSKGNFMGFAPVSFSSPLNQPELKYSAEALKECGAYFNQKVLFINDDASRHNFLRLMPGYNIVTIFSHAIADTAGGEPILFMRDSIIRLSELQLLQNPVTKLVVLSACETNVGKNATGEGIYSMARGFSAAGIPSVAATLWDADEASVYVITQKFHEYLASGMPKDEALQKAKIYFIQKTGSNNQSPYYWANMILIGNSESLPALADAKTQSPGHTWWYILFAAITLLTIILIGKKLFTRQ